LQLQMLALVLTRQKPKPPLMHSTDQCLQAQCTSTPTWCAGVGPRITRRAARRAGCACHRVSQPSSLPICTAGQISPTSSAAALGTEPVAVTTLRWWASCSIHLRPRTVVLTQGQAHTVSSHTRRARVGPCSAHGAGGGADGACHNMRVIPEQHLASALIRSQQEPNSSYHERISAGMRCTSARVISETRLRQHNTVADRRDKRDNEAQT
jgi:hypothetical protein